jgi:hypothetical protein
MSCSLAISQSPSHHSDQTQSKRSIDARSDHKVYGLGKLLSVIRIADHLQLVIIEQDRLRIENRQIHSIVGSIHGNSRNFSDRIYPISEITLEWSVLRENKSDNLFCTAREYWNPLLCTKEDCINGSDELPVRVQSIGNTGYEHV